MTGYELINPTILAIDNKGLDVSQNIFSFYYIWCVRWNISIYCVCIFFSKLWDFFICFIFSFLCTYMHGSYNNSSKKKRDNMA
ncbi:unnamed protein product [Gordionus sp. m RMFG-2023]